MRIALIGMGRMGRMIRDCAADRGIEVAAEFNTATIAQLAQCDRMDAVIDFSAPASLPALAAYVQRTGTPLVSGTTGYCDEEAARVNALGSYAPVAVSANFSIGVAVLKHLAAEAAALLPDFDIEIIETHHRMKKDAPSGTAKLLLSAVNPDGTHPTVFGREGFAPRTAGIESRKENFTANERSKPQSIPTAMVVPERERPGTVAAACERPTSMTSVMVAFFSVLLPWPMRSAANSSPPVTRSAKPMKNVLV